MDEFCHWKYHCHSRNYSMGETQPVKLRQIVCLQTHNTYMWNDLNLKWKRAESWHIEMMLNSNVQVISHKILEFLYTYCSTHFLLITGIHNKCSSVIHWSLISSLTINSDKNGLQTSCIHHGRGRSSSSWLKTRFGDNFLSLGSAWTWTHLGSAFKGLELHLYNSSQLKMIY